VTGLISVSEDYQGFERKLIDTSHRSYGFGSVCLNPRAGPMVNLTSCSSRRSRPESSLRPRSASSMRMRRMPLLLSWAPEWSTSRIIVLTCIVVSVYNYYQGLCVQALEMDSFAACASSCPVIRGCHFYFLSEDETITFYQRMRTIALYPSPHQTQTAPLSTWSFSLPTRSLVIIRMHRRTSIASVILH
jgi:hypothetical protein